MRHQNTKKRLGRITPQRKALVRSLLTSFLLHGKVKTTKSRARALVSEFDSLVTRVRRQPEKREQIRVLKQVIYGEIAQRNLMDNIIPSLEGIKSGFTRTVLMGPRKGDSSEVVFVELLSPVS